MKITCKTSLNDAGSDISKRLSKFSLDISDIIARRLVKYSTLSWSEFVKIEGYIVVKINNLNRIDWYFWIVFFDSLWAIKNKDKCWHIWRNKLVVKIAH